MLMGIALTPNRLILGESQREVREKRAEAAGHIHLYRRDDMKLLRRFSFPKIGQIAEIRVLDHKDEHHWPEPLF